MYVPKQALAWLFVVGAGLFGWWLWWSSDHRGGEPVAAAAEQPAAAEPLTLRLTIVTPNGETTKDVKVHADPVPEVEPARAPRHGGGSPAAATVHQDLRVLAHDGAIIYLGGDGELTANTGDVRSSGAVTIDSEGSTLQTGQSTVTAVSDHATGAVRSAEGGEVVDEFAPHLGERAVAISGYENHSVNVAGNDQIVTYDDSNVYINRNGEIMGNSGDTDSSGLNALYVVRSVVRSGDSADAPPGQEEPEEPEEPDEEEEQAAGALAATASGAGSSTASGPGVATGSGTRGSTGSGAVTDDDGGTTATGRDPLVIGGDGYDDLGIRSSGNRNIVTYDDSNVVVGGTGPAMTQIGDSDTGGAVVMAIFDSDVRAGNAF